MSASNLVGKKVTHRKLGEGTISGATPTTILITFHTIQETQKFPYPDSFKTVLTAKPEYEFIVNMDLASPSAQKKTNTSHNKSKKANDTHTETTSKANTEDPIPDNDFFSSYERALICEIAYLRENGGKPYTLYNGKYIMTKNGYYYYYFESDTELSLPDDIEIEIKSAQPPIKGKIISCNDFSVTLTAESSLGDEPSSIDITVSPWRLLNTLIQRLKKIKERELSPIVHALIYDGMKHINDDALQTGQENALHASLNHPITFIWGPPGTGKTETLSKIALKHMEIGHRVLVLSHSNVSVDGATLRVDKLSGGIYEPGQILRYGYPKDKAILNHRTLSSYNYIINQYPELAKEQSEIQTEISKMNRLQKQSQRYINLSKRLAQIRKQLKQEEILAIRDADFIATTASKAVVDKEIYENQDFDVVIFDEASMSYVPQIIFAASLANRNFICIGDFNQLPPIVQNENASLLEQDIFQYCGITKAVQAHKNHAWLYMLNIQYRMHPDIAEFVSNTMYNRRLLSPEALKTERVDIVKNTPFNDPINFVDLSGMMTVCHRLSDQSHINPLSAMIAIGLAIQCAQKYEVGIITPYNAQSRLLNAMIRDISEKDPTLRLITCATVHQFQGSEKDVIIYDAVDCYREKYPGILLTNSSANKLFNVAMTRARGKFILIANGDFMKAKRLSSSLIFRQLIDHCEQNGLYHTGADLINELKFHNDSYRYLSSDLAFDTFINDLKEARKSIFIDIPKKLYNDKKMITALSSTLETCKSKGIQVKIRAEEKSTLPPQIRSKAIENQFVWEPITIIDKKIVWFGEPPSDANFIAENKTIPTIYRPIIRLVSKKAAQALFSRLDMNKQIDEYQPNAGEKANNFAQYVAAYCICDICGNPMKLKKGKKKKSFFLGCSTYPKCRSTQKITVELLESYFSTYGKDGGLRCKKCNYSLMAEKRNSSVYVHCCGIENHTWPLDEI